MDLSEWTYLWADLNRYALYRTKAAGLVVVDTERGTMLLMEDDQLRDAITERMLLEGSRVLEKFP